MATAVVALLPPVRFDAAKLFVLGRARLEIAAHSVRRIELYAYPPPSETIVSSGKRRRISNLREHAIGRDTALFQLANDELSTP